MSYTSVAKLETNVSSKSPLQSTSRKFWISAQVVRNRQKCLLEEGACVAIPVFPTKSFAPLEKSGEKDNFFNEVPTFCPQLRVALESRVLIIPPFINWVVPAGRPRANILSRIASVPMA